MMVGAPPRKREMEGREGDDSSRREEGRRNERHQMVSTSTNVHAKRPAPESAERVRKKSNRMFKGLFLGTLSKSRRENEALEQSEQHRRRAQLLQRASARSEEAMAKQANIDKAKQVDDLKHLEEKTKNELASISVSELGLIPTKAQPEILWCINTSQAPNAELQEKLVKTKRKSLEDKVERIETQRKNLEKDLLAG